MTARPHHAASLGRQVTVRERKVLSVLVPARQLLKHAGSTVPAIAQDGPSSERGSDMHPDELLACYSRVWCGLAIIGAGKIKVGESGGWVRV